MSASAQKAVLQEALDLSHQFRENSALRNGLPTRPPRNVIHDEPPAQAQPIVKLMRRPKAAAAAPVAAVQDVITQQVVTRVPGWIKGAAVTSLVGLSGLGGIIAATLAGGDGQDGRDGRDATAPPAVVDNGGDLLYWLKREGYDLPPRAELNP